MSFASVPSMSLHLRYHRWASRELLRAVESLSPEVLTLERKTAFGNIHRTLLHIYQADSVWWLRLAGKPAVLPKQDANVRSADFAAPWSELLDQYVAWADALEPQGWEQTIRYKTSAGDEFSDPAWKIVLHVVNHGTAHRAQVASMLRQSEVAPPNLDLIMYYRLADKDAAS